MPRDPPPHHPPPNPGKHKYPIFRKIVGLRHSIIAISLLWGKIGNGDKAPFVADIKGI